MLPVIQFPSNRARLQGVLVRSGREAARTDTNIIIMEKKVRYGLSAMIFSSVPMSSCAHAGEHHAADVPQTKTNAGAGYTAHLDRVSRVHIIARHHLIPEISFSRHQHRTNLHP